MKISDGFSFYHSHHAWCCLVDPSRNFWEEILRQTVIKKMEKIEGSAIKAPNQIKLKEIQSKAI
jgi:hypothetical protein